MFTFQLSLQRVNENKEKDEKDKILHKVTLHWHDCRTLVEDFLFLFFDFQQKKGKKYKIK